MRLFDPKEIHFAACQHAAFMEDIDKMRRSKTDLVKHAHWIIKASHDANGETDFVCSSCYCISPVRGYTRYCPNCGALMDREVEVRREDVNRMERERL